MAPLGMTAHRPCAEFQRVQEFFTLSAPILPATLENNNTLYYRARAVASNLIKTIRGAPGVFVPDSPYISPDKIL